MQLLEYTVCHHQVHHHQLRHRPLQMETEISLRPQLRSMQQRMQKQRGKELLGELHLFGWLPN
jgi:hypothetical protein